MLRFRAIHLALAVLVVAGIGFAAMDIYLFGRPAFPLDDAWIHLQFATRMAEGDGLSYTADRWVTGSTAPLWSALLSIGGLLPGGQMPGGLMLVWSKLLAALALAGAVLGAYRLSSELAPGRSHQVAGTAAILVATTPWLLWSAAAGMEITTFTCLALWGMVWHVRELRAIEPVPPRGAALLAASALARPEGGLLLALALGERWLRCRQPGQGGGLSGSFAPARVRAATWSAAMSTLVALVVTASTLAFYRVAGGSFLPTTFWAKAGGPLDPWPDSRFLRLVLEFFARSQPAVTLLAGAGILVLVARLRGPLDRGLLPAAWLVAQPLAYSLMTRPGTPPPMGNFGRYFFPLLPVMTILGLLALTPFARRLRRLRLWVPLLGLVLAAQLPGLLAMPFSYTRNVSDVEASDVAAAQWLAPRLDPSARIAVQDVGALAFFLPNEIVDLAGLTSPEIRAVLFGSGATGSSGPTGATEAEPVGAENWQQRLYDHLRSESVDYLVVFEGRYPAIVRSPGFRIVRTLRNPDNRTMAGDTLLIVRTPWCRHPLSEPTS